MKMKQQKECQKLPPGPRPLPFFGNILEFRRDQLAFIKRVYQTYGSLATIYIGSRPMVLLSRPEYVYDLLVESGRNFLPPQNPDGDMARAFGGGLLSIEGEEHLQQRRFVQPAFHKKRVDSYGSIIVQETLEMLDTWHEGTQVDIAEAMKQLTLRITARSLFHINLADRTTQVARLFTQMFENQRIALARLLNLYIDLPFTRYGKRQVALREIDAFIFGLIAERRITAKDEGDVMSMLLTSQETGSMNDKRIRDHVITFMTAGHETTTNALTWAFYLLSQHTQARMKLLTELQTILGGRVPGVDDLPRLPYLEWVANEILRLYPPVWLIVRRALKPFELAGYHFPADSYFLLSQWIMHRHPEFWIEPDLFRPERWDPRNNEKVPLGTYFPFSAGLRFCIGASFAMLELKLILATTLQRYSVHLVPGFQPEPEARITLRAKKGMPMIPERTPALPVAPLDLTSPNV
jgi:cytochrome P450